MKNKKYIVRKDMLVFFIEWLVLFVFTLLLTERRDFLVKGKEESYIYLLAVAGVLQFVQIIRSASKVQEQLFTPYALFLAFMFVFNYGQFALWTFGIHSEFEITKTSFIRYIDNFTAIKMEVISMQFMSVFHLFALIGYLKKPVRAINYSLGTALKRLSVPILIVSGTINILFTFFVFNQAKTVGYAALFENALPPVLKYLSYMFVPALCLTLVSYKFSRKVFIFLTAVFAIYALPLLITGDRGSWIYFIGPWAWCYLRYVRDQSKPIKKSLIVLMVAAFGAILIAASAFKSVRDVGLNSLSLADLVMNDMYEAFVHPFFEMGQSAILLGVVEQDHMYETWEFGNTYISALLGMFLPRISVLFGYPDMYVENWMTDYLNMGDYGVGFSSFAEAYLNGGPVFGWFYMAFTGFFIGYTVICKNEDRNNILRLFLILSTAIVLGPSIRASLNLFVRMYFWGVLLVIILSSLMSPLGKRRV